MNSEEYDPVGKFNYTSRARDSQKPRKVLIIVKQTIMNNCLLHQMIVNQVE